MRRAHVRRILRFTVLGGILLLVIAGVWILSVFRTLPSPELLRDREIAESTKIFDRTGTILLYEIHGEEKRTVVPPEGIPLIAKQATLAIEDANFYEHSAIDFKSILRAFLVDLRHGAVSQGGSTITQQLAKNTFLTTERTLTRKIKELLLAFELERKFTKDEILYLYLNQIPYGSNAYGIEAASQIYFGKSAKDLALHEVALLAALPKAPSYYSPWGTHTDALLARKNHVLDLMAESGYVSPSARDAAKKRELIFKKPAVAIQAPHFVIAVQEYLQNKYGEDFVREGGLRVTTTLDWKLQELAERVVEEGAKRNEELYKGTNAALVAENPQTGEILALVGSRNYFDIAHDGNFNVATQGLRQPGSAIKPLVYLTAFEEGYTPDTVLFDLETEFDTTGNPEKSYKPHDFDDTFRGPITLRNSLAQSINITSVKTLYLAGIDNVLANAKKFGITTLSDRYRYGLSLVLGGGEVKLAELVGVYGVLANEGIRYPQVMVSKVETADGVVLEETHLQGEAVVDPQYPRLVNDILSDIDARRPLYQASLHKTIFPGHQVALKTGTSNDYRDAWAMGYTRSLAVGVWAGNNNNEPMQKRGGSVLAAVPIWSDFMGEALTDQPLEPFTRPEPIPTQKPVLNGSSVVTFESQGVRYPQVHEILFYVDKDDPQGAMPEKPDEDPQFNNWEAPVLAWATTSIQGFVANFNKPIPPRSTVVQENIPSLSPLLSLRLDTPANGSFVRTPFEVRAHVEAPKGFDRIEVYVNNTLVATQTDSAAGTAFDYRASLSPSSLALQNTFRIVAYDKEGRKDERELILFMGS